MSQNPPTPSDQEIHDKIMQQIMNETEYDVEAVTESLRKLTPGAASRAKIVALLDIESELKRIRNALCVLACQNEKNGK